MKFKKLEEIDLFKMFQNWDKLEKRLIKFEDRINDLNKFFE